MHLWKGAGEEVVSRHYLVISSLVSISEGVWRVRGLSTRCPLPAQMVRRGELPEPTSATHLVTLKPLKRVGGKMSKEACQDPELVKYIGECHGGKRVWGDHDADIYVDEKGKRWAVFCCGACKAPLPWLPLPPPAAPSPPATLTSAQKAMIEEKRQAALARKRAREEREVSSSPPCCPILPTAR